MKSISNHFFEEPKWPTAFIIIGYNAPFCFCIMNTQYPVQPTQPKTAKRKMNWFDNSLVSTATQAVTVCPAKI